MLQSILGLPSRVDRLGLERLALVIQKAFADGQEFTPDEICSVVIQHKVFEALDLVREHDDKRFASETGTWSRKRTIHRLYKLLPILESIGYIDELDANPKKYRANSSFIKFEWDKNQAEDLLRATTQFKSLMDRYGTGSLMAALSGGFSAPAPEPDTRVVPLRPNKAVQKGMDRFIAGHKKA